MLRAYEAMLPVLYWAGKLLLGLTTKADKSLPVVILSNDNLEDAV
jgi:hypothetical protein